MAALTTTSPMPPTGPGTQEAHNRDCSVFNEMILGEAKERKEPGHTPASHSTAARLVSGKAWPAQV